MIRINREELLARLQAAGAGLAKKKETIEQSGCFVLKDDTVTTYNEEVCCRGPSGLGTSINGAVPAEPLLKALAQLTEEQVKLEVVKGQLVITGASEAGRKTAITMESEVLLNTEAIEEPGKWRPLPADFETAMQTVLSCVSRDAQKFCLTCIHVCPTHVEACDNYQLCRHNLSMGTKEPFLLRHQTVKDLVRLGVTKISEGDAWVHFQNAGGLTVSARRYLEPYPDLSANYSIKGQPVSLPPGLTEAVKRAEIFSAEDKDNNRVRVTLRKGALVLRGEGASGWHEELKDVGWKWGPMEFLIRPYLLVEMGKHRTECQVAPTKIKIDGGKFVYIACLMQAKGGEEPPPEAKEEAKPGVRRVVRRRAAT